MELRYRSELYLKELDKGLDIPVSCCWKRFFLAFCSLFNSTKLVRFIVGSYQTLKCARSSNLYQG